MKRPVELHPTIRQVQLQRARARLAKLNELQSTRARAMVAAANARTEASKKQAILEAVNAATLMATDGLYASQQLVALLETIVEQGQ